MSDVWREPGEETEDYPGLVVQEQVVTGSIRPKRSYPALWAITGTLKDGWEAVAANFDVGELTNDQFFDFIHHLLEARGEFARLICVLADVEREDSESHSLGGTAWWERPQPRERVAAQLRRCLECLEGGRELDAKPEEASAEVTCTTDES